MTIAELQQWAEGPVWLCRDTAVPVADDAKKDLAFFTLGAPAASLPKNCTELGRSVATNGVDVRTIRNYRCGFPAGTPSAG